LAGTAGKESQERVTTLAVYDCMLFFRAAIRPKGTGPLFDLVHAGQVTLCLSPDVLIEVRDVLSRPKLVAKYPALTAEAVDAFLAQQLRVAKWVSSVPEHYVLDRDPKDSKYLNLAITASSPYVATTDRDLLDLMEPTSVEGRDFRHRFPAVQIVRPATFEAAIQQSAQ
jgi:putative PIN family toxin of toxin-antitoxin system